ncbi:hypothetical protein OSTOST_01592, partial [Ostertagia ostertagi]
PLANRPPAAPHKTVAVVVLLLSPSPVNKLALAHLSLLNMRWVPLIRQFFVPSIRTFCTNNTGAGNASLRQISDDAFYVVNEVVMKRLGHVPIHK